MNITKILEVNSRKELREWFKENHKKAKDIWILYYKKHTNRKSVSYREALEEALCFGWIDTTVKRLDEDKYAQRFTPRRKNSPISEMNKQRVRNLIKQRKMTRAGLNAIKNDLEDVHRPKKLEIAPDILKELKKDDETWKNFQAFPEHYRRIRIAYIENYRNRGEMFQKVLKNFLEMTKKNKRFGMLR